MELKVDVIKEFEKPFKLNIGFLLLSWAGALSIFKVPASFWWTGLVWVVFFLFVSNLVKKDPSRYSRAWVFHIMFFFVSLPGFLSILDVFIRYFVYVSGYQPWKLFFAWFFLLIWLTLQIGLTLRALYVNLDEDISAGRLNIEGKSWNLAMPFSLDKNNAKWTKIGSIFSPLVVAFGFWLTRNYQQNSYQTIAVLGYFGIGISFAGLAKHIAIAIYLRQLEKKNHTELWINR
jgi:hypothetical protein